MNTRIEIPFTLPPPHFDDEATIATARQVVPIKSAARIQGRLKALTLIPVLIASMLCGALGAIAVIYFERRGEATASVTQQPPPTVPTTQAKTEPSPVSTAPEVQAKNAEIQDAHQSADSAATSAADPAVKTEEPKSEKGDDREPQSTVAVAKREPVQDAAKLVRKRRVGPAESEIPVRRNRRTEAGRIEDLFTGPNP